MWQKVTSKDTKWYGATQSPTKQHWVTQGNTLQHMQQKLIQNDTKRYKATWRDTYQHNHKFTSECYYSDPLHPLPPLCPRLLFFLVEGCFSFTGTNHPLGLLQRTLGRPEWDVPWYLRYLVKLEQFQFALIYANCWKIFFLVQYIYLIFINFTSFNVYWFLDIVLH